jgi:hypothetical protein
MHIFRRIFLSNYWWQESNIWSQASYRYPISWEAFLDPSDSYFLLVGIWCVQKHFPRYGVPTWSLWPNIRFLPSIVAEKNVMKNVHICSMCIKTNYSIHIVCNRCWKELKLYSITKAQMYFICFPEFVSMVAWVFSGVCNHQMYYTPAPRRSRNLTGPKTLPTIWYTYMTLVTKYQISAINSGWEKCDATWAYMFNVYKNQQSANRN